MTAKVYQPPRRINAAGLSILKAFEGCRLEAYLCPAGVWTIGWGETGPGIGRGVVWTQDYADHRLDLAVRKREAMINRLAKVPLTGNQFSALVSMVYNIGEAALGGSTLLRKLNAGDYIAASEEFTRWNRAGGRIMAGLTRRRIAERDLFLLPD